MDKGFDILGSVVFYLQNSHPEDLRDEVLWVKQKLKL